MIIRRCKLINVLLKLKDLFNFYLPYCSALNYLNI